MSANELFTQTIKFAEEEKVAANQEVLERVTRILFVLFMPDDEPMSEDEVDELLEDSFGMASVLMAVCGMNIIGENDNGDYVVRFKPYKSLEDFAKGKNL